MGVLAGAATAAGLVLREIGEKLGLGNHNYFGQNLIPPGKSVVEFYVIPYIDQFSPGEKANGVLSKELRNKRVFVGR